MSQRTMTPPVKVNTNFLFPFQSHTHCDNVWSCCRCWGRRFWEKCISRHCPTSWFYNVSLNPAFECWCLWLTVSSLLKNDNFKYLGILHLWMSIVALFSEIFSLSKLCCDFCTFRCLAFSDEIRSWFVSWCQKLPFCILSCDVFKKPPAVD